MLHWKPQGPAFTADVLLTDGRAGKVVVVAARANPNGAALLLPTADGSLQPAPLASNDAFLSPSDFIEVLLFQERAFGNSGLPAPEATA